MTATDVLPTTIGKRYQILDRLGAGGMGIVYRAADRLTGDQIALKQVLTTAEFPYPEVTTGTDLRLALAHEFRLLASLRHPNIISVLDYGFDTQTQPYYTMELLEQARPLLDEARTLPFPAQIDLLIQILQALAYLHRRGIKHRDLKPANVMTVGNHVKVLDFGLAVMRDQADKAGATSGTIAYMAPEILLGEPASERSDLYAVGVMAYELFVGHHPFDLVNAKTMSNLIDKILNEAPDLSQPLPDDRLFIVLDRLLAKLPEDRYPNAAEVIDTLQEILGEKAPSTDKAAIQESFLQAAQFVGRETEFDMLSTALRETFNGKGSKWLIAGEAGVGKSRLLEELRVLALVKGTLVLHGQENNNGTRLYELWRQPLRWLSLYTELDDLEASILKVVVPDISMLQERNIPDAPALDSLAAAQERLFRTVEETFKRQQQPVLLILDNLSGADESLALLNRLNRLTQTMPLMIVAAFEDNRHPDLPSRLPDMRVMKLLPLSTESIAELSESMIGLGADHPDVIDLLERESSGNVFYIIEIMRALAEETGDLQNIALTTLPQQVFGGGIQRILKRRLDRAPKEAMPLLQLGALYGQRLDLKILKAAYPNADLDKLLYACGEAAVLQMEDEHWRFSDDELSEYLLEELSAKDRRTLYQRLAEAIETAYPDVPDMAPMLAHYWGRVENSQKEAYYSELAGEQALATGAYRQAATFLSRAVALDKTTLSSPKADRLRRGRLERELGDSYTGLGQAAESQRYLRQALVYLGSPEPDTQGKMVLDIVRQIIKQIGLRRRSTISAPPDEQQREFWLQIGKSYDNMSRISFLLNESLSALHSILASMNVTELTGLSPDIARAYGGAALAASGVPLPSVAEDYLRRAHDILNNYDDPVSLSWVCTLDGIYHVGVANWERVQDQLTQALVLHEKVKNVLGWEEVTAALAHIAYYRGDFTASTEGFIRAYEAASISGNMETQSRGLLGQAMNDLPRGKSSEALKYINSALQLLGQKPERFELLRAYGLLATAQLRERNPQAALASANLAEEILKQSRPTIFASREGFVAVAEVRLAVLEAMQTNQDRLPIDEKKLRKSCQDACKLLKLCAQIFPIAQPRYWLYQGLYEWLGGHSDKARKAWQKSLEYAEKLSMPYDLGLACYEIGRHLPSQDPAHQEYLNRAAELFKGMGATYDLDRTTQAMKSG